MTRNLPGDLLIKGLAVAAVGNGSALINLASAFTNSLRCTHMAEIQPECGFPNCDFVEGYKSWLQSPIRQSPAATALELALRLAAAESSIPRRRMCSWCEGLLDAQTSNARFRNVFCSEGCERDFVREALASVSGEDCARMQRRLDGLWSAPGNLQRDVSSTARNRWLR